MRAHVDAAKVHPIVRFVIVDSEIHKALVASSSDLAMDELRRERSISHFPRDVVDAIAGEDDLAGIQPNGPIRLGHAGQNRSTVFVMISRVEMRHKLRVVTGRDAQYASWLHDNVSK